MDAKAGKLVGQYLKARAEADAALTECHRLREKYNDLESKCAELALTLQEFVKDKKTRREIRIDEHHVLVIDYNGGGAYNTLTIERME